MNKQIFNGMIWKAFALFCILTSGCTPANQEEPMQAVIERGLQTAGKQALQMAEILKNQDKKLPKTLKNGELETSNASAWTSGFFPGELWYLYEHTKNETFKEYAELFTARLEEIQYCTTHHDVGFMLYCSYGNGYRLTGNSAYKDVLVTGARSLSTRFRDHIGLMRSWESNAKVWQYPVIIDNMMNLELLMWAFRTTGEQRFKDISLSHADKTMENHFRPNYSCYHVVSYDTITGQPHCKVTHQGIADESTWARGHAWALYGYTMMYRESKKPEYLALAQHVGAYLMNHPNTPADRIPYWDYDAEVTPETPRDASSAAIMASALIELSTHLGKDKGQKYLDYAEQLLRSLTSSEYLATAGSNGHFTLMHSTGNLPANSEIDVPLSYADYYYVEALLRMKKLLE